MRCKAFQSFCTPSIVKFVKFTFLQIAAASDSDLGSEFSIARSFESDDGFGAFGDDFETALTSFFGRSLLSFYNTCTGSTVHATEDTRPTPTSTLYFSVICYVRSTTTT